MDIDPDQLNDGEGIEAVFKEPFSIMAQNLLSCALKLERASKRKQRDIWMRQSMQDTV